MQLTAFLLTVCCIAVSAKTVSQNNITFSGSNVKLETVFNTVKKQTGYYFVYNKDVVSNAPKITVDVKNIPLEEFMQLVLKDQNLEWVLQKTTILIQKKKQQEQENKTKQESNPVTGIIRGPDGAPLPGINITIKGTKHGTTTDSEGRFNIDAQEGNTLQITGVGFEKQEIKVNQTHPLVLTLKISTSTLDEVQYIAYGQTSKRFSTSNIGTVKAADIEKQPVTNPLLTLQARVPGLFVTQTSGISGSSLKIRIQGQNSILKGSDPLYVVDGVPIDANMPNTGVDGVLTSTGANYNGFGNPLNYINPSDIESIDVLKDADATAIYGSRAANGAILITTKKGKAGPMKFDLDMQTGIGRVARKLDMMNTRQYLDMRYEAFANDKIDWRNPSVSANDLKVWDTTHYTDWQNELLGGNAQYTNVNASVSGGTNAVRYLMSGTYNKQTTVFPFPDFADQKAAFHVNLNTNSSDQKLRMQFSANFMFDDNRLPQSDITRAALLMEPNAPRLLNADGSINWAPDASGNTTLGQSDVNVMIQKLQRYQNKTYNLIGSFKLDYTILPGLTIGSSVGYNYMQTNDHMPYPLAAIEPEKRPSSKRGAIFGDRNIQTWIAEPQANYRTTISMGKFDVIVGGTFQENKAEANNFIGEGQLSDELLDNINSAATIEKGGGSSTNYRYNALFARANYNWNDRYIVNVNARRDGSSRFGADHLFHNFGSVGAAWIFSSEKFFERYTNMFSFGKLRGSYGTTGSDQIGDYQFMSLYNISTVSAPYQGIAGLSPASLPNPALQWEETRKLQVGMDVGLWQDRLMINATFVRNRSSNQLLNYNLPTQTGRGSYLVNFPATIQNKNWEFSVTGKIVEKKSIEWTSSINLTLPQNKLVEFPDLAQSAYSNTLFIGQPVDATYYYHWLGVAPGTGDYLYADQKGNPILTPTEADRTVFITRFPTLYGGLDNTVSYKNIHLSFIFQFVQQCIYNDVEFFNSALYKFPGMFQPGLSNQPVRLINRWQNAGDHAVIARYSTADVYSKNLLSSDRRYLDAYYIRLKNVSLSWDLPQQWLDKVHFRNLRLYMHAQNLLTFTNYKGLDPETQSLNSLPPLQVWTGGIQLGL